MSEGHVTQHDIAVLSKEKQKLEIQLLNAISKYNAQKTTGGGGAKKKSTKKRAAPITAVLVESAPAAKKEKKKKEKKEPKVKPAGWLCAGNLLAGTPCPEKPVAQIVASGTRHNGETRNTCKSCKKAMKNSKK